MEAMLHTKVFLAFCTSHLENSERECTDALWGGGEEYVACASESTLSPLQWISKQKPNYFSWVHFLSLDSKKFYHRGLKAV